MNLLHQSCSDIVKFHDVDFEIIELDGERWVLLTKLARALGYSDHRALHKLLDRRSAEFANKTRVAPDVHAWPVSSARQR